MEFIISTLLEQFRVDAESRGSSLLVVHIPHGNSFVSASALAAADTNPDYVHLMRAIESSGISFIDLQKVFPLSVGIEATFELLYLPRTPSTRGHFSVRGNRVVADLIAAWLSNPS